MRRTVCREQLFKLLFQIEFSSGEEYSELAENLYDFDDSEELKELDQKSNYMDLTEEEKEYISSKFTKIIEKVSEIDTALNETITDWPTDRIGKVELAILRLGYYEMKYDDEIPESVAINEAVELAKKYGSDESFSFVNGVLGLFAEDKNKRREATNKKDKSHPERMKNSGNVIVKSSSKKKE